jgi:hypothetical protein
MQNVTTAPERHLCLNLRTHGFRILQIQMLELIQMPGWTFANAGTGRVARREGPSERHRLWLSKG